MLTFIDIKDVTECKTPHHTNKPRIVSLSLSDKTYPHQVTLLGNLPHNSTLTFDKENAQKMIEYLQKIVDAPEV